MTDEKTMAEKSQSSETTAPGGVEQLVLRPPVDIYEDDKGITVRADMPGVSKEGLNVHVDKGALSIEGQAAIDMPEGMEAVYADVHATSYRRDFSLSSELDTKSIDANLKDGVLTLHIAKRAEVQPRKIEVRSD